MVYNSTIRLKKAYGQHFLQDQRIVQKILDMVPLGQASVFEIGPGGGVLTRAILTCPVKRLWAFEIDPEWAAHLQTTIKDERLTIIQQDFLQADLMVLEKHKPWILLANLPYNITFPILHRLQQHRHLIQEGVIMVQDEVALKLTKKSGRGFGASSLFFQYYFEWQLLDKIPPSAFNPPPKVFSRLMHFKPRFHVQEIPDEDKFWHFIKQCFAQPRRTLVNNLKQSTYAHTIPSAFKDKRAQQLTMHDFLTWWHQQHQH